jgi:hypothetical protein
MKGKKKEKKEISRECIPRSSLFCPINSKSSILGAGFGERMRVGASF